MRGNPSKFLLLAALAAIVAITVVAYYPGMSAGFYFDDEPNFARAAAMKWTVFNWETLQGTLHEAWMPTRPVANVSLALTHLISGLDAAPYHWTNLVIHLLVGLSLFWVIRLLQHHHAGEQGGAWFALLIVFLFLVHPLNVQAVTYVVQRMTSLATLFFLLGLGCYLTGRYNENLKRQLAWFGLTTLLLLFSIGSKEVGYLLLPLLLLYEICFHRSEWRTLYLTRVSPMTRLVLISSAGMAMVALASVFWYLLDGHVSWLETMPHRDFSGFERILTQGRVQFFYLSLLLWPSPSRLNLDHDFLVSRTLFDPLTTAFALAGWLVILFVAILNIRSRPRLAFPVLAYLLLHSVESAPINLELVFEHRMYLPMTMLALLLALNLGPLTRRHFGRSFASLLVIGLLLATATHERNKVWGDPIAFLRDCAHKSPNKWRPQYNLGTNLGQRGMLVEAKTVLEQAIVIKPNDSETHNQLGNVYMKGKQQSAAEKQYRLAVEHNPKNAEALYNLSVVLSRQHRYAEQKEVLEQFILRAPPYLEKQKQWAINYLKSQSTFSP